MSVPVKGNITLRDLIAALRADPPAKKLRRGGRKASPYDRRGLAHGAIPLPRSGDTGSRRLW